MAIKTFLSGFALSVCLVICLLPSPAFAMPGYPSDILNAFSAEPQPFRRDDEIEGRTFEEFNDESFLHRFSYRIPLDWQVLWDQDREGFIITAGSTRSDELFVNNLLRKTIPLNEKFFGIIRFERSEDFDSRFDRFLTGVGAQIVNGWSLALLGNVVGEKEDISPQFELTWDNDTGDRFRAAFIMTDYLYNSKTDDSEYETYPYTIFTEGKWVASERVILSGWINYNTDLTFEQADASRFSYDQFMMEASAFFRPERDFELLLSIGTQTSDRSLAFHPPAQNQQLDRDNVVLTVEAQCDLSPSLKSVYGIHYFFLDESGIYQNTLPEGGKNIRREYMPFTGLRWRNNDFGVSPTVYLDLIDLNYPTGSSESDAEKLIGKLALPLHYYFSARAMATFDVTMELHEADFGGFDVQFVVLF